MSDLDGNPEDCFSRVSAHTMVCIFSGIVQAELAGSDPVFCNEQTVSVLLFCTTSVLLVYGYVRYHGFVATSFREKH